MNTEHLNNPSSASVKPLEPPFLLTDIQQAYWLGEQEGFHLRTSAIFYRVFFAKELDIQRLSDALTIILSRHPATYTKVLSDGTQQTPATPPVLRVGVHDLRQLGRLEREKFLENRENTYEDILTPMSDGPQLACFVDQVEEGYYINFLLRLISFDARGIYVFFNELAMLYMDLPVAAPPDRRFCDLVALQQTYRTTDAHKKSVQYWNDRINDMPSAPELPLVHHDKMPEISRFRGMRLVLTSDEVTHLGMQARKCGVTINALFCTLYADVLRVWSRNSSFMLNLLMMQRPVGDKQFADVIGNFSVTLLLEIAANSGSFQDRAKAVQRQLYRDIAHTSVSGVEVIRAMHHNNGSSATMPFVFASSLGLELPKDTVTPRNMGWTIATDGLRTPQVWLDHQAYLMGDQLILNMDFAEGVFLPGTIEDLFSVYESHLRAVQNAQFDAPEMLLPTLPESCLVARRKANQTEKVLPQGLLHDFYEKAAHQYPDNKAIIAADRTLTYTELWSLTTRLATQVRQLGVGANDLVAVLAQRGWRQVSALMSVVQSGGAYLPIASDLPLARKTYLCARPGVKVLLVERALLEGLEVPDGVTVLLLEEVLPNSPVSPGPAVWESIQTTEDLAYVIFTSGSTGEPKGVAIDHRGAVNTIQDVIARFGLTPADRVIGISAYNFDLSVYDVFGALGTGSALVLPAHSDGPAPDEWARVVREHGVTVWNTVPALLEMQIEYCRSHAATDLASLRLVMLSGDWIPVSLPARVASIIPGVVFISMGGATEASIWSNYFEVKGAGDPEWDSIPYGWPLANQSFHVLDQNLQPAPTWVAGDLYIGGIGLAKCYYNDPKRTADSFITHPQTGERLYRTGDVGRYHASGYLEFLGRNDNQVKIRGFRIELGEIDTAMERCPCIRGGSTIVRTVGERDRQLVAFYVRRTDDCDENKVREHLAHSLPEYMVPPVIVEIEQMPVTPNGKVDRKALLAMAEKLTVSDKQKVAPRNETETQLVALWQVLLGGSAPGVDDSFFEMGGTSLMAVRLLNSIKSTFDIQLPLASLLRHDTIASQAQLLQSRGGVAVVENAAVVMRDGADATVMLVHPVGGNILCYREMIEMLPAGMAVIGLQSPGNGQARNLKVMAEGYVNAADAHLRKDKPIYLLGWSMGGVIAHEMTRLLELRGVPIAGLTMIDSWMGDTKAPANAALQGFALLKSFVTDFLEGAPLPERFDELEHVEDDERLALVLRMLREGNSIAGQFSLDEFAKLLGEHQANFNALIVHRPEKIKTVAQQFRATRTEAFHYLEPFYFNHLSEQGWQKNPITDMDEDHFSIFKKAALRKIIDSTLVPSR